MLRAYFSVGVTSVRVADRLIYFLKRFGAFIILQLADYYTYGLTDLLLFLIRYSVLSNVYYISS